MTRRITVGSLLLILMLAGCAGPTPSGGSTAPAPNQAATGTPGPTLLVATRAEPPSLSSKPFRQLGLTQDLSGHMFNAGLAALNDQGQPVPYLAAALPQLDAASWQVNDDGTMRTTYTLRPNLMWHDGQPLTADDFVFAYEVYSNTSLGVAGAAPLRFMAGVTAPDPSTVSITWGATFPQAGQLEAGNGGTASDAFPPLPRHILSQAYQAQDPEAFMANAFWSTQYVGAGPYRLDDWVPGAYLEGSAFSGFLFGAPKIARIHEAFVGDPDTVVANILAGAVQLTVGDSIRFNDGQLLRDRWADQGRVLNFPTLDRLDEFQRRPEFASTMAFTDLRVRQALAYGVDFDSLNGALQGGMTTQSVAPIEPTASYYAQLDAAAMHYPYDPQKTAQLMRDAGFTKGNDGVWVSPNPQFGRMAFVLDVVASPDSDNEMHLMAETWRN